MSKSKELNKPKAITNFLDFLSQSPTQFHATFQIEKTLKESGYVPLDEAAKWSLKKGGKYYLKRNDSAIIAFKMNGGTWIEKGFRILGAHTDSPGLKVKPNPENYFKNYLSLGVEPYGGAILATWFDRDLSLAGKVSLLDKSKKIKNLLIDFNRPIAIIPSLAIHLDRNINEGRAVNKQKDLPPLLLQMSDSIGNGKKISLHDILTDEIKKQRLLPDATLEKILDYELFFYDTQKPSLLGVNNEFVASGRIDNLLSCYVGLHGFLESGEDVSSMLVFNDHEECGSSSLAGAGGNFLASTLTRIAGSDENYFRMVNSSIMVSADNAHGVHPNFPEKHDPNNMPLLNMGPVIKINANMRYATDCETGAFFRHLCESNNIPYQKFVSRSDMPCGSTIGPITSTLTGIKTVDIGAPTFAMHSVRELAGSDDIYWMYKSLMAFFRSEK